MFFNYSLLYGRRAGNFTDHGEVRDMDECLRLCCSELSCKLALMLNRNCYSVACVGKFCRTVPIRPQLLKLKIAHVIRLRSQFGATRQHPSHHPPGAVSYNVTLHHHHAPPGGHDGKSGQNELNETLGGKKLEERNHSDKGYSEKMSSKFPYRIFELSDNEKSQNQSQKRNSFAFQEFDQLDTLLNLSVIHKKRAVDVSKYLVDIGEATIETGLRMVQIHFNHEPQSQNDKDAVKIGRRLISAGERILSRAETVLKAVTNSKGGLSSVSKSHVPTVGVHVVTPVIKMISLCSHGPPHYGVTLLGGIRAGHFVGHGKVDNMQACIKMCCANHECDLAFMVKKDCYSVICYHKNLCRSVRAQHVKRYRPRIAHIWRGTDKGTPTESSDVKARSTVHSQHISTRKMSSANGEKKGRIMTTLSKSRSKSYGYERPKVASYNHSESVADKIKTNPTAGTLRNKTVSLLKKKASLFRTQKQQQQNVSERVLNAKNGTYSLLSTYPKGENPNLSPAISKEDNANGYQGNMGIRVDFRVKDVTHSRIESSAVKIHPHPSTTQKTQSSAIIYHGILNNPSFCPHTPVKHSVGLKRGLKTGKFTYIGELVDIRACLETCCRDSDCDIAFMLDQSCYTVACASEPACGSVPYHQHKYSTAAIFVSRRFNKHAYLHPSFQSFPNKNTGTAHKPVLLHHAGRTRTLGKPPVQNIVQRDNASIGIDDRGLKHTKNQELANTAHENAFISNNARKQPTHSAITHGENNSSEKWINESIKIDLNGGKQLGADVLKMERNSSIYEQWQHEKFEINFTNSWKLRDKSTLREKIKINFVEKPKNSRNGKESYSLKHGKIRDRKAQNETININFLSLPREKAKPVFKSEPNKSAPKQEDKSLALLSTKVDQGLALEHEGGHEKETKSDAVKSTNSKTKGSTKVKLGSSGKKSVIQGESDFYEQVSGDSESVVRNTDSIGEQDENANSESGMIGSVALGIKADVSGDVQTIQGEPLYYSYKPLSAINHTSNKPLSASPGKDFEALQQVYEQNGGSQSGESGSSLFGSGIDFDSNEASKDFTSSQNPTKKRGESFNSGNCSTSETLYNVTFRDGIKAGNFSFAGRGLSKVECVTRCCLTRGCDVTFMILDRCFLVHCDDDKLCDVVEARNAYKFKPVITYVNLTVPKTLGAQVKQNGKGSQFDTLPVYKGRMSSVKHNELKTNIDLGIAPIARSNHSRCNFSQALHNVSFRLGGKAGIFRSQGRAVNIGECAQRCCKTQHCNIAFMISQDCFSVRCHSNKTCQTFDIHGSKLKPTMMFVGRQSQVRKKFSHESTDRLASGSHLQWDVSSPSSTAFYPITSSWIYSQASSSNTASSLQAPDRAELFSSVVFPSRTSSWSVKTIIYDGTGLKTPELEQSKAFMDNSSEFVEVKTNGSEFWWQYYTPEEEQVTNSSFESVIPEASGDTNKSTNTIADDLSPSIITESRALAQAKTNNSNHWRQYFTTLGFENTVSDTLKIGSNSTISSSPSSHGLSSSSIYDPSSTTKFPIPSKAYSHSSNSALKRVESHRDFNSSNLQKKSAIKSRGRHDSQEQHEKRRRVCTDAEVVTEVTLKGGYYAGVFTRQDNATIMSDCTSECCRLSKCNLAIMVANICYAVQCFSKDKCKSVKAYFANKYHPMVAYVRSFNEKSWEYFNANLLDHDVTTRNLRCVLHDIREPKHKVQRGSFIVHLAARDLGDCAKLCCLTDGCDVAVQENGTCYSMNCHGGLKCPENHMSRASLSIGVIKELFQPERTSERLPSKACDFSQVLRDVVLRGGSHSGKFKYLAVVENMETCIKECCKNKLCDVALMLKDDCFLVSCYSEALCDAVSSRSSEYHPQLAYKIKHGKRRNFGKH